jgi:hypothetical protein
MIIYDIKNPGGSDTQYQYNNGGIFGGTTYATLNDATVDVDGADVTANTRGISAFESYV